MLKIKYIFIYVFTFSSLVFSQGVADAVRLAETGLGAGARAIGMGNSFVAVSDDFSATMYNPAGLGLVKRFELSTSFGFNKFKNNTTLFGGTAEASQNKTDFNQLGFVYPMPTIRGSMVFSVGYNKIADFNKVIQYKGYNSDNNSMIQDLTSKNDDVPYYLGLSYPIFDDNNNYLNDATLFNGRLQQEGEIINSGSINQYSFAGAIEVAQNLFIGATFNLLSGDFKQTKNYYEDDIKNIYGVDFESVPGDPTTRNFESFNLKDEFDWDLSGYNFKLGLMYVLEDKGRFGMTIKTPDVYTIKERYMMDASAIFGGTQYYIPEPIDSEIEYEISTPFEFSLGAAFTMMNNFIFSGQLTFIDYTQTEYTSGLDAAFRADNNSDIKKNLNTVFNYNIGVEYNIVPANVRLRAGYMSIPSAYLATENSDYTKKYLTFGAGYLLEQAIAIDVAYVYGWWKDYGDSYSTGGSTYYQDIKSTNLIMSISYRF